MSMTMSRGKTGLKNRKSTLDVDRTNEEILDMCPIFRDWCEVRSQRLSSLFNDCIYRVQPHDYVTLDEKTLNKKPRQWRRSLPAIALYTHKRKYADPKIARARSRSASFMGAMAEQKLKTQLQYENEKERHVNPYKNMIDCEDFNEEEEEVPSRRSSAASRYSDSIRRSSSMQSRHSESNRLRPLTAGTGNLAGPRHAASNPQTHRPKTSNNLLKVDGRGDRKEKPRPRKQSLPTLVPQHGRKDNTNNGPHLVKSASRSDTGSKKKRKKKDKIENWAITNIAPNSESEDEATREKSEIFITPGDGKVGYDLEESSIGDGPHEGRTSDEEEKIEQEGWLEQEKDEGGSDEYDTDLEEEMKERDPYIPDGSGVPEYERACEKAGLVPVTFLANNLAEGCLRMKYHYLGGTGTKPFAKALMANTVCEEIDISDNYIEGSGAKALAKMLKDNMFIVNLNLSNNFIRSQGSEALCDMLETNTTLKRLSLEGNQLSDSDAVKIGEAMHHNMSLDSLDLSHNYFAEVGGMHIAYGITQNIGISDLDLSWNSIREKGAVAIGKALSKNKSIEIIDLSWNGFAENGTAAIAQSLKSNKSIKVLDLSNNRVNEEGAKKLALGVRKNEGLETLLLGMNPINLGGVEAIIKAVHVHPNIKLLGLEDVSLCKGLPDKIKELEESREIIIMYSTGSPQQAKTNQTVLAVFDKFITENLDRLEDIFIAMDKDKSGDITLEEFKYGLKDFGLRLTSKQLDQLLYELDADGSGTIEFDELVGGSVMVQQEKEKKLRQEMEDQMMAEAAKS